MHILKFCRLGTVLASALSLAFFIGCGDGGGAAAPAGMVSQPAASAPVTPAAKPAPRPASRPVLQPVSRQAAAAKVEQTGKTVDKPLPLKDQMRTLWKPPLRGVIYNWLACGPFPVAPPNSQPASMSTTDFLADSGGELAARPQAGQEVRRRDGTVAKWIEFTSKTDIVYLQEALPTVDIQPSVVYFAATVQLAGPGRKIIDLSSRDDIKVFWNGKEVGFLNNKKFVGRYDSLLPVEAKAGENLLLLRLYSRDRRGFMCRINDERSTSLARKPDIVPALPKDPNDPNHLAVKSDVKKYGQNDVLLINVRGPSGKLMASEAIVRGDTFACDTATWADGPYEVQMFCSDADGKTQIRYLNWHKGDYMPLVRRILDECDELPVNSSDPVVLKKRLIGDILKARFGGDARKDSPATQLTSEVLDKVYSALMEYLEIVQEKGQTIGRGGFYRLAWRDEIDDSPQFARVFLPLNYDPERKYPLVVYLHGHNWRNLDYATDEGGNRHNWLAEKYDVIYMRPYGRGNTWYRGIGEADVMRAVRLAKETFNIDEDRVYLMGQSMGGGGAWYIGTRHTGVFAAVAPVYGGWDYHVDLKDEEFAKLSPQQVKFNEASSSFAHAESLLNTPIFVLHGDSDATVNVEHSRYAVRMLQRWGYDVRYCEVPGKGHENLGMDDEIIEWFLRHRLERNPRCVRVRSAFLDGAERTGFASSGRRIRWG